ncbi:MAG: uracil-DNA glycosylase [Rhodobacterales bacterium]|nr:uracil-DNA glycosylase [Rhodobacterales bacterium]
MKDELDEIAALAADLHALLEDVALRGRLSETVPTPEELRALQPESAPGSGRGAPTKIPQRQGWADLASAARERVDAVSESLEQVRQDLGDCQRCRLCSGRKQIVFGVGDPNADLVICGEAPGYDDDQQGEPYVGPAGEMLDKMLQHVLGLQRGQVYLLNVVKCRPPKDRNPEPGEVATCLPYLERQLQSIQPKALLVLGPVALQALFGDRHQLSHARGSWLTYNGIPTLPTYHPEHLLRQPQDKRLTFQDLKDLRMRYDAVGGKR